MSWLEFFVNGNLWTKAGTDWHGLRAKCCVYRIAAKLGICYLPGSRAAVVLLIMIRLIKRRFAVRAYVRRLSQELVRRFNIQPFYSIEQVTRAAEAGGFSMSFLAYAHAIYCSRADFDSYYGPLHVRCTYDGLRKFVVRRYLKGLKGFDALRVIRAVSHEGASFSESHIGDPMA